MLVGLVLNVNAFVSFQHHIITCPITKEEPTLAMYIQRQPASIIRLFMIPYCVSCYSGIANSTPNFFSIFPMQPSILIPAIVGSITFPALLRLMADIASHIVYPKETDLNRDCRRSEGVAAIAKFWTRQHTLLDDAHWLFHDGYQTVCVPFLPILVTFLTHYLALYVLSGTSSNCRPCDLTRIIFRKKNTNSNCAHKILLQMASKHILAHILDDQWSNESIK